MYYRQAPAQALTKLMSPEDILAHPCGEYVLDQLQRGVSPDKVADVLLQEYLVVVDSMRLRAYRRLCEQSGDYWTLEHLELQQWEYLYQQMPVEADGGVAMPALGSLCMAQLRHVMGRQVVLTTSNYINTKSILRYKS